jgi:hypothetical protein
MPKDIMKRRYQSENLPLIGMTIVAIGADFRDSFPRVISGICRQDNPPRLSEHNSIGSGMLA